MTLYECLTLKRPFEAPSREGLYRQILTKEPDDPRRINAAIPQELSIVLATAMDKDADRRYATAEEFADDLRRVRELKPIAAQPVSALLRTKRWAQRNPAVATMTAGMFLLITAVAAVRYVKNSQLAAKTSEAEENARAAGLNEQRARKNAEEAQTNLTAANRNLADFRRMADVKRLEEAKAALKGLWPLGSALLPRLTAFEKKYGDLVARLPDHEKALAALEARADPYRETDEQRDHSSARKKLLQLAEEEKKLEKELDGIPPESRAEKIDDRLDALDEERAALEATLKRRLTWRYSGPDADLLTWKRQVLADLVEGLRGFADPKKGAMAQAGERRRFSELLVKTTLTDAKLLWDSCLARIAGNAAYKGLAMTPQEGLIPLGPDPTSHFEEFLHWASHDPDHPIPQRDAEGKLPPMDGATGVILVLLPGGTFTMGATPDAAGPNFDPQAVSREGPPHTVPLSPFFMAKHELTRGQWVRLSGRADPSDWYTRPGTGGSLPRPEVFRYPVEQVSWLDVRAALIRGDLVLPTEARWEYACRAGTATPWSWGKDAAGSAKFANLADESYKKGFAANAGGYETSQDDTFVVTAPVGSFAANGFGLHDMHGNVWEWCLDTYAPGYGRPHAQGDGLQADMGSGLRVVRGGGFGLIAILARSSYRSGSTPASVSNGVGCRAARGIAP